MSGGISGLELIKQLNIHAWPVHEVGDCHQQVLVCAEDEKLV